MTLHDYAELIDYWADHPPAHLIAAAKIGWKGRRRPPSAPVPLPGMPPTPALPPGAGAEAPASLGALLALAPNGIARAENLKGLG